MLDVLSDPNVAFILFVFGALCLAVEIVHPNMVTGVIGVIALLLAFVGFDNLPLNVVGLLLLAFGFVLFVFESQIVSHGLLTAAGIACVLIGGSILYNNPDNPSAPIVQVAPPLIFIVAASTAIFMSVISIAAVRTRRMQAAAGTVGVPVPIGSTGLVQAPLEPTGTVYLAGGEAWTARTADGRRLARDTYVRLVGFDRLVAIVEPLPPDAPRPVIPASPAPMPADRS
jgi:membrane-bound serine protease (ClpP class)